MSRGVYLDDLDFWSGESVGKLDPHAVSVDTGVRPVGGEHKKSTFDF